MGFLQGLVVRLRIGAAVPDAPQVPPVATGQPLTQEDLLPPDTRRQVPHRRWLEIEIVGERSHQEHIASIRALTGEGVPFPIWLDATDVDLVAVIAAGKPVGHILSWQSAGWRQEAKLAAAVGEVITGEAKVFGGTIDKPSIGVFGKVHWPGRFPVTDRFGHELLPKPTA